ncbi:MAG: hypothetical protein QXX38_00520 [Candidatus Aenigmatarchaeota archaeon]
MEETAICKVCLEPIYNFICVDCLKEGVKKWISVTIPEIKKEFLNFHRKMINLFFCEENGIKCIKCKRKINIVICPYCYEKEVFWLIFSKNIKLAKIFSKFFNFDFLGVGYLPTFTIRDFQPVVLNESEEEEDLNICESCGQVSYVKKKNGVWLCESCKDEENYIG